jgi:hypothetical protein
MSTAAQIAANRQNAQLSSGPVTETGKAASSKNHFKYGFCGQFTVLPTESQEEFDSLVASLVEEHQPATGTESILVDKIAQHFWLSRRAQYLQDASQQEERQLALFLRYQGSHDRAFHKCLSQLVKLRAEKRKMEIGFESQKRKEAEEARRQEAHEAKVRLMNSKAEFQELETEIKSTIEAPLPGYTQIPFDALKLVLKGALTEVARDPKLQNALNAVA